MDRLAACVAFRELYTRVMDPEVSFPGGPLVDLVRAELRDSLAVDQPFDMMANTAAEWSTAAARRFTKLAGLTRTDPEGRQRLVRRAAIGWAPLGLASGAWLQWLTSPGTADEPLALRLLALYAGDVGVGHPGAARGDAYLGLLRALRISENAAPLARLAGDPRIGNTAFRLPAMLALMSRRPDDFREELVGADLCLRAVGSPPPLAVIGSEVAVDWAAIDYSLARNDGAAPLDECRTIAEALAQRGEDASARVRAGFTWAMAAVRAQVEAAYDELSASLDPGYDMAELIRLRAREGAVYHHQVLLEGRPLAEWLKDCMDDPGPFTEVLARSRLVKPGRSSASALVNALVSARGPMFRVFSPDDLAIISRWIDSLAADRVPPAPIDRSSDRPALPAWVSALDAPAPPGRAPQNLREAYHRLMTRVCDPALRDWSLRYVRGWLARARQGADSGAMPLPDEWRSEGLRPWLKTQHDRHSVEFDRSANTPLPSREAVVDDAVQTAPLTLIDGSWLQGFTDYELASSDIGYSLFATYWDELGNGRPRLNHPLIYRDVLKGMDVDLPPTASPEFATWPGFRDSSFELPVYWLCVGRFPRTFLPEVLGLNLAMELSGVGGSYRRAALALREHGFSTRFVDIHNTIDNVATGHSAWAADAVDTLMARLQDSPGPGCRTEVWARVRTGYRSLSPPDGFLARRAARRAWLADTSRWRPKATRSAEESTSA